MRRLLRCGPVPRSSAASDIGTIRRHESPSACDRQVCTYVSCRSVSTVDSRVITLPVVTCMITPSADVTNTSLQPKLVTSAGDRRCHALRIILSNFSLPALQKMTADAVIDDQAPTVIRYLFQESKLLGESNNHMHSTPCCPGKVHDSSASSSPGSP